MVGEAWKKVVGSLVVVSQESPFHVLTPGRKRVWGLGDGSACCVSLRVCFGFSATFLKLETAVGAYSPSDGEQRGRQILGACWLANLAKSQLSV